MTGAVNCRSGSLAEERSSSSFLAPGHGRELGRTFGDLGRAGGFENGGFYKHFLFFVFWGVFFWFLVFRKVYFYGVLLGFLSFF